MCLFAYGLFTIRVFAIMARRYLSDEEILADLTRGDSDSDLSVEFSDNSDEDPNYVMDEFIQNSGK
jgi:hypothetical protein